MKKYFNCNHCNQPFYYRHFKQHLEDIHNEVYENYIKNNYIDFIDTKYKLCIECNDVFRGLSKKCGDCFSKTHNIKSNQLILCKYCNENIYSKSMSLHLKKEHNVDFKTYINCISLDNKIKILNKINCIKMLKKC